MPNLADSHCHILDPRLIDRAEEIVENLAHDGLEFIVEISASVDESHEALKFAESHNNVYCTLGVHPHMIHEYTDEFEHWAVLQKSKKIAAIGECGLDYYHMPHPKELQKEIFARQIVLASKMKLPLVVHTRNAFDDTLEVLVEHKEYLKYGILLHCFSESEAEVMRIREHFDCYFAFGGAVTYKNNKVGDGAVRAVPLDRILLETDAPYLAPEAVGGRKVINEPKYVRYTAEHVAGVLGISFEDIARITLENTKRFYGV